MLDKINDCRFSETAFQTTEQMKGSMMCTVKTVCQL